MEEIRINDDIYIKKETAVQERVLKVMLGIIEQEHLQKRTPETIEALAGVALVICEINRSF